MLTLDAFVLGGLSGPVTTKGAFQRASQCSHPQHSVVSRLTRPSPLTFLFLSLPLTVK